MTLSRLRRIVRARWWVLVIIAFVTIAIATVFVNARNDSFPKREAIAGVTFQRLLGEPDDTELQQRLSDSAQVAAEVNAPQISTGIDPLSPGSLGEVVTDTVSGRLLFIGRGDTNTAANTLAVELRERYLGAQPLDGSAEIERRISQTTAQLDGVVARIAAATEEPPMDAAEIERRIGIRELQAELTALNARYGALTVELITPADPPRPVSTVEAERRAIRRQLNAADSELLALQEAVVEAAPEDAEISLLRSEEAQLRLLIDDLVAQRIADEPVGTLDPIDTRSSGIESLSALPIQALGLVLGLFIGLTGLVLLDRSRQPVWAAIDVPPRYRLPEIAKRRRSHSDQTSHSWYLSAPQGRRKANIQQLRSHVEGLQGFGSGVAVGIASLSSQSRDVHELAADLAASLAGSGTRTLLIDADFGNPTALIEFRRSGCDLKTALDNPTGCLSQADPETDETSVSGISISRKIADSPDLLARPEFADLLTAAKYEYGVVIIACPPSDTPGYHVLTQRLDAMILVADAGAPLPGDLDNALHALEDRRSHPLGIVLLTAASDPLQAAVRRIPGGPDLRRAMAQSWFRGQPAGTGTQRSHAEEKPAPAAPESAADTIERRMAPSTGVRVEFVSGSSKMAATVEDSTSDRAPGDGPSDDSQSEPEAIESPNDAPSTSDAAVTTAETANDRSTVSAPNGSDQPETDQIRTAKFKSPLEKPDTNRRPDTPKRNAKGQFVAAGSPEKTAAAESLQSGTPARKTAPKQRTGQDLPEKSSDKVSASDRPTDAAN